MIFPWCKQHFCAILLGILFLASSTAAFSSHKNQIPRKTKVVSSSNGSRQNRSKNLLEASSSTTIPTTTSLRQDSVVGSEYLPEEENGPSKFSLLRKLYDNQLFNRRGGALRQPAAAITSQDKDSFLKRHPFVSAVTITTINAVLADVLTQVFFSNTTAGIGGKAVWVWQRTLVFGLFGFLYQGMVQYTIVNGVWEKLFPGTSKRAIAAKICAMNLLSDPILFMPTFYVFQQTMTSGTLTFATIKTALLAYKANCLIDWRNSWMVWFPGHAVTYGVMPKHKRIPWMAFLSFFYMCVLSMTRG